MTDPPAAVPQPPRPQPGRMPMERLRGLDETAPGTVADGRSEPRADARAVAAHAQADASAAARGDAPPAGASPAAGASPEPPPPSPAVIARGERPVPVPQPATGPAAPPPGRGSASRKQGSFLRELPILLAIAIVLALLIKTFLVQAFFIPSGSMEQTLHIHDRVLVNKLSQHTGNPQRGDIVVFDTSGTGFADDTNGDETVSCPRSNPVVDGVRAVQRFVGVGTCGQDDYIKRVIAVPGDTIRCCDQQGRLLLDGKPLDEPYVFEASTETPFCRPTDEGPAGSFYKPQTGPTACGSGAQAITVPAGMYWVMGDHRDNSSDSRYNGFVPRDKIVGRAFVRIWPPSRIGFLRVPSTFPHIGTAAAAVAATPLLAAPALTFPLVGVRLRRRRRRGRAG